ncbi:MAG TPA: tryptophan--tRNA ligase [Patescibacteria group bacterium]|nr:tryptophan--tRNA ligase [Patescibacteria group bacterium]
MNRLLSALQPSGFLHLGNYFGMIDQIVSLQKDFDNFVFVVDYHAITVPQDPKKLREHILFSLAVYLAAGIDPVHTTIFQQSRVPQHTELCWILNCTAHMGELERMTQFKDKAKGRGESVSVGLFDYPVLMAADILLYDTNVVPVGEDQKQHVELARTLAERFNRIHGDTFAMPEARIREHGARLMGLDDPTKKMSKSAPSPKNYLSLLDDADAVRKKIMSAVTDTETSLVFDPQNRPGLANLLTIFSLVAKRSVEELATAYDGMGYAHFKKELTEAVLSFLIPLQERIRTRLADEKALIRLLEEGGSKARTIAEEKMQVVREKIGVTLEKK